MYTILKGLGLFFLIITIMPLMFFLLIGSFGGLFEFSVHKESWLATTKIKWIKLITNKFLV